MEISPWGQSLLELDALGVPRPVATQSGVGADATERVPPVLDTLHHESFPQRLHQAFQTDAPWESPRGVFVNNNSNRRSIK